MGTWHCYEPSRDRPFPYQVAICRRCGHVFGTWNRDQTHLYTDQEYVTCATDLEMYSSYVIFVLGDTPHPKRRLRILDIGCNQGALLKRFYDLGFDCYGIEPGPGNVEAARKRMPNAHIDIGLFTERWTQRFKPGFFDVVLITSVLEHLVDPAGTLSTIRSLLHERGRVFIFVPDLASYTPTFQIRRGYRERYGGSQLIYFYRNIFLCYAQHISHFSGPSLTRYLPALGLLPTRVASMGTSLWALATPCEPSDHSFEYEDLVEFHGDLMDYYDDLLNEMRRGMLDKLRRRTVVCYGAGREFLHCHDVFKSLDVEVVAVADDSPQAPDVCGVPCVEPRALASFCPDVCIATSFDFEEEIADKARSTLPPAVEVLTLTDLISEQDITTPCWVDYRLRPARAGVRHAATI
jgi:SAM-dependent methyltransferase